MTGIFKLSTAELFEALSDFTGEKITSIEEAAELNIGLMPGETNAYGDGRYFLYNIELIPVGDGMINFRGHSIDLARRDLKILEFSYVLKDEHDDVGPVELLEVFAAINEAGLTDYLDDHNTRQPL